MVLLVVFFVVMFIVIVLIILRFFFIVLCIISLIGRRFFFVILRLFVDCKGMIEFWYFVLVIMDIVIVFSWEVFWMGCLNDVWFLGRGVMFIRSIGCGFEGLVI